VNSSLTKKIGKRILSEANDLKRTISALSVDIEIDEDHLQKVIDGNCSLEDSYEILRKMGAVYPIDISELYIQDSDRTNSVKIMTALESLKSSRVYDRININGKKTPYYEYRDTAMSNIGPYKPEWIKELRVVSDSDPENPDVVYNNGHFLHQTTFFVGPVNFYWEVNGKKFCREMNTGDSNYITPFWPHSFTSRDSSKEAYILAVTFGGEVRRAQKELYALGEKSNKYYLDYRNKNKATKKLIEQLLIDENLTLKNLNDLAARKGIKDFDIEKLLQSPSKISFSDLKIISNLLNVNPEDLIVPNYQPEDEVVVKHSIDREKYFFPNRNDASYRIDTLARTAKMPLMKSFNIDVLLNSSEKYFDSSLHTYAYNYGAEDLDVFWFSGGKRFSKKLKKDDSIYIEPFTKHGFTCKSNNGQLYLVRVSGAMNLLTQKELSYFSSIERTFKETKTWFD